MTFKSKTTYYFDPEDNILDQNVEIIVPNLLLMTGMLKNEVQKQPDFIKTSIVWPISTSVGLKEPFIKLKVSEFLWGYEDELACLETSPETEDYDPFGSFSDDFFEDDFSEPSEMKVEKKKKNFRNSDGKCNFGILVERNSSWESEVSMMTGATGLQNKGNKHSVMSLFCTVN